MGHKYCHITETYITGVHYSIRGIGIQLGMGPYLVCFIALNFFDTKMLPTDKVIINIIIEKSIKYIRL